MKAQSISSNVSALKSFAVGKNAKTNRSDFDAYMSQGASQAGTAGKPAESQVAGQKARVSKEDPGAGISREGFNQNKISLNSGNQDSAEPVDVDLEAVSAPVMQLLQDVLGLSEEEIVDILGQLGITPMDLALVISPNMETVQVTPLNLENIKAFIMEVHGVDDPSLFLTSDAMSTELGEVMNGIQEILSGELGIDVQNMSQDDTVLLQSFAEKFVQIAAGTNEQVQNTAAAVEQDPVPETLGVETEIPVVVEVADGAENTGNFQSDVHQGMSEGRQTEASDVVTESPLQAFTERLTESFESVRQDRGSEVHVTMNDIVEQVVRQVRIRVLPQTTSMELQLNPESLGRVRLNVTSGNGMATATLTVQNQMAKEALESQITVLRDNLESQGLKVDSVEVNVSEFGFKNPEDSNNQYQQKKSPGRKFRLDSSEEEKEDSLITSEDRQDGNSVVDYTA